MIQTALPTLPYWRSHTKLRAQETAFILNRGGIGDFINWCTPIHWAISNHPHIYGFILCPTYFADLARHWFKEFEPRFFVETYERVEESPIIYNKDVMKLMPHQNESANPIGFHPMDLGWAYYCHLDESPEGDKGTLLPIDEIKHVLGLPNGIAVVHTESIFEVRTLPAKTINEINQWLVSQNIKPVFLGKKSLNKEIHTRDNSEIDFSCGIDLRNKTNLVEAGSIMAGARVVVGLDNGLLHLASCTMTPVVYALSNIDPKHRKPRRRAGTKTVMLTPPPSLPCRYCQSRQRLVHNLDFRNCWYGDMICCEMLNSQMFIEAMKEVL